MLRILGVLAMISLSQEQLSNFSHHPQTSFGDCRVTGMTEGRIIDDNEIGVCVKLLDCPQFGAWKTRDPTTYELQLLRLRNCGFYYDAPLVCCSTLPAPGVCGKGSSKRIHLGNKTGLDEHRWMALLQYTKPQNVKGFHCSGSLINHLYVLTAAHCTSGRGLPETWQLTHVRLGEWDLKMENECVDGMCADPPIDVAIDKLIPHENYNPYSTNQAHDIALLRLERAVPYNKWIIPLCLPRLSNVRTEAFFNENLEVVGWGRTELNRLSNVKLRATLRVLDPLQCNDKYRKYNIELGVGQMCAGGELGIDACTGDSGGPLVHVSSTPEKQPYVFVVGLVSIGPDPCGQKDFPGIYTRVAAYIDWIDSHIQP